MTTMANITCTKCGAKNDAHTEARDETAVPKNGDLSICLYCGHITAYVVSPEGITVRELTEEEAADIAKSDYIQALVMARKKVMEHVGPAETP